MVNYLLRMMSSWAIVCSVWYLPPMSREVRLHGIDRDAQTTERRLIYGEKKISSNRQSICRASVLKEQTHCFSEEPQKLILIFKRSRAQLSWSFFSHAMFSIMPRVDCVQLQNVFLAHLTKGFGCLPNLAINIKWMLPQTKHVWQPSYKGALSLFESGSCSTSGFVRSLSFTTHHLAHNKFTLLV